MAVGDVTMPQMHVVKGVKIGSTEAYVRYQNRRDLVIFEFVEELKCCWCIYSKCILCSTCSCL